MDTEKNKAAEANVVDIAPGLNNADLQFSAFNLQVNTQPLHIPAPTATETAPIS